MEDFFGNDWNTNNPQNHFYSNGSNLGQQNNDLTNDIFGTSNAAEKPSIAGVVNSKKQASNTDNDIWDLIENPNASNDIWDLKDKLKTTSNIKKKHGTSNLRNERMLTKKIKQISKITPAAKWFIAAYFKHECKCEDDIIIPESVEILGLMYLGHPAFIQCYIADNKNGQQLQSTHKLFIVFGYHTLNDIIEEYFNCSYVIAAIEHHQSKQNKAKHKNTGTQTDFTKAIDDLFAEKINEKEHRTWKREIRMPIPPYNGTYKETFNQIDELFFAKEDSIGNTAQVYNDWDEFLGIDESKKEKKLIVDDWKCVDESMKGLFDKNGLCEIEILIEQKDILGNWIRDYKETSDPLIEFACLNNIGITQMAFCQKDDIKSENILNLKYWK